MRDIDCVVTSEKRTLRKMRLITNYTFNNMPHVLVSQYLNNFLSQSASTYFILYFTSKMFCVT